MAQTITGTIVVTAAASSSGGGSGTGTSASYITPQTYGGAPDGTTDNYSAMMQAVAASAAAFAAGTPKPVFLSAGSWFWKSPGWGGVSLPSGVEVYGESGTIVSWDSGPYGYPALNVADGSSGVYVHDLTFSRPTRSGVLSGASGVLSSAEAVNNSGSAKGTSGVHVADCVFDASCINSLFGTSGSLIENCQVNGAVTLATLSAGIVEGSTYSSLACDALSAAIPGGSYLIAAYYPNGRYSISGLVVQEIQVGSAGAAAGATSIPVVPFTPGAALPVGAEVQEIIVATGLAMTGAYSKWSTVAPGTPGVWNENCQISGCTVLNCDAADIFINMGYKSLIGGPNTGDGNIGWIGHDMNFDFEYCMECTMQGNEGHFGGNRGCAVETVNSQCQVLDNKIYDVTGEEGIRVTTDLVPSGNPYNLGGHTVSGNEVYRAAVWGIAFQGVDGLISGNTVQGCLVSGIHLENAHGGAYYSASASNTAFTTVRGNTVAHNIGVGVDLLNTMNAVIEDNEIAYNGDNGVAKAVTAPALTAASSTASTLAAGTYLAQVGWLADVYVGGSTRLAAGPPSLPGYVDIALGQQIELDVALPPGAAGLELRFNNQKRYGKYPAGSIGPHTTALLEGCALVAWVDLHGNVTLQNGVTSGVAASVNSDGSLHVVLTADQTPVLDLGRSTSAGFGIWYNGGTGNNQAIRTSGNNVHDNGWAGMSFCNTSNADTFSNHTAYGVYNLGTIQSTTGAAGAPGAITGATISGSPVSVYNPGSNYGGAKMSDCTFSASSCCVFFWDGGWNAFGWTVNGCTLSGDVGIYFNTSVYTQSSQNGGGLQPGLVENCNFTGCTTPIDENGGTLPLLTIGSGNTGLPAA